MKTPRVAGIAVAIALLTAGWCYQRSGLSVETSLLDHFDNAVRQPRSELFHLTDVALNGETKRAVALASPAAATRLTWKRVRVPDGAWLRVYLGIQPRSSIQEALAIRDGKILAVGRTEDDSRHLLRAEAGPGAR